MTALALSGYRIAQPIPVNDSAVAIVIAQVVVNGMNAYFTSQVVVVAERTLTSVSVTDKVGLAVGPIDAVLVVFDGLCVL